jgi:hypothetical protein
LLRSLRCFYWFALPAAKESAALSCFATHPI